MGIRLNKETREITCPSGDTGKLKIKLTQGDGTPLEQSINGVGVFAVCEVNRNGKYREVASKPVAIVDNVVPIIIDNAFSAAIDPDKDYRWDVRIVTSPVYSEDGRNVFCDESTDEVHSIFAMEGMPVYKVPSPAVEITTIAQQTGGNS